MPSSHKCLVDAHKHPPDGKAIGQGGCPFGQPAANNLTHQDRVAGGEGNIDPVHGNRALEHATEDGSSVGVANCTFRRNGKRFGFLEGNRTNTDVSVRRQHLQRESVADVLCHRHDGVLLSIYTQQMLRRILAITAQRQHKSRTV